MLEAKTTVIETKEVFERLTSRMDTAKERISEFEEMSIGTSKTKKQREKK